MTNTIEKQNVEIGNGWWAKEKTDYKKILEWKNQQEGWDEEARIAKEKADELLKQMESEKTKKDIVETGKVDNTPTWKDGEERKKNNPWQYNEQRVNEGSDLVKNVQKTDSNNIANRAQRTLKKRNIFW